MSISSPTPTSAYDDPEGLSELVGLAPEVVATVHRWLATSDSVRVDTSARRLADVLKDPAGLGFTVALIDGVVRPEDAKVAAHNFAELARDVPGSLPWHLRSAVRSQPNPLDHAAVEFPLVAGRTSRRDQAQLLVVTQGPHARTARAARSPILRVLDCPT